MLKLVKLVILLPIATLMLSVEYIINRENAKRILKQAIRNANKKNGTSYFSKWVNS